MNPYWTLALLMVFTCIAAIGAWWWQQNHQAGTYVWKLRERRPAGWPARRPPE